jgi:hypothetical protein
MEDKPLSTSQKLTMKFAGGVVKHLGLQMYSGPVPAIAELIANAWDADASIVKLKIPFDTPFEDKSTIEVEDNGKGMNFDDCDNKYLIIGRDARKEEGDVTTGKKRKKMAHKGLGKLAGFGIAEKIEVKSIKGGKRTRFLMDYSAIDRLDRGENYTINPYEVDRPAPENDGTTIILKDLKIRNVIIENAFLKSMARRFSVLSDKFKIYINGAILKKEFGPFEMRIPGDYSFPSETQDGERIRADIPGAGIVKYWIGFTRDTIKDDESRGITILARGKLVQRPWFFEFSGGTYGQHGMQYMTGEIEADFLDENEDLITTDRNSVQWTREVPALLKQWGREKVADLLTYWAEERAKKRLRELRIETPFLDRIEKFPPRERKELEKVITKMASIPTIEEQRLEELVRSLINAYENRQLMGMIEEVSSMAPDAQVRIFEILQDYQVLEAVTLAQIVKSHISIIEKFKDMIESGVKEKPDMQNHLKKYPWLIDSKWFALIHEKRLETLMEKKFHLKTTREGKRERIDFFCLAELGRAFVVEVKRPGEKIGHDELDQIEKYVDFLRDEMEKVTDEAHKRTIFGYLIGSDFDHNSKQKRDRLRKDGIYTYTWESLLEAAILSHREFYDAILSKAPRNDPRILDLEAK